MEHREWQRKTALSKREREREAMKNAGKPITDAALDQAAAAYVGVTAEQVARWRVGRK